MATVFPKLLESDYHLRKKKSKTVTERVHLKLRSC